MNTGDAVVILSRSRLHRTSWAGGSMHTGSPNKTERGGPEGRSPLRGQQLFVSYRLLGQETDERQWRRLIVGLGKSSIRNGGPLEAIEVHFLI